MKPILLVLLVVFVSFAQNSDTLRIVTLNVWSGLDYKGIIKMGEYESEEMREKRFSSLIDQLKELNPDVLLLQEVNPADEFSSRLAGLLGYDYITQICNAGLKIGSFGIPVNLNEGNAILARKNLHLKEKETVKLSGSFGFYGDIFSLHFDESNFLLAAEIEFNQTKILLLNTHLTASTQREAEQERIENINDIIRYLNYVPPDMPVILGGDFNAVPESDEIKMLIEKGGFIDCYSGKADGYTWEPGYNTNTMCSIYSDNQDSVSILEAEYDKIPRRIDYIFVNSQLASSIKKTEVVINSTRDSIFASDHFGVMSTLDISGIKPAALISSANWDFLPIVSYDSDFGFGYGIKAFLLDQFDKRESLDFIIFNSTKGERWYRFVLSLPDFELRQRTIYPFAFDLTADYDKINKNNFFGIGNNSEFSSQELYTREMIEFKLQFSKGITSSFVAETGLKYKYFWSFNFQENSKLAGLITSSVSSFYAAFLTLRSDTRDSFINPSKGTLFQGAIEYAPSLGFNKVAFSSVSFTGNYYKKLFYPKTIFAARILFQDLIGNEIPVQNYLSIGGNNTLRGYMMERYLDKTSVVFNSELRFPLYYRFGGILGIDAGNVWNDISDFSFKDWKISPAAGFRYYFDTFIVRLDFGFSRETTGFFLNFGHIF